MEKKLPKVYANKIEKEFANNDKVYYDNKTVKEEKPVKRVSSIMPLNQKINQIFGSSRYVYKADVDITTKDGVISKKVIGRNKHELITMDNELIKINDIVDIEFSE